MIFIYIFHATIFSNTTILTHINSLSIYILIAMQMLHLAFSIIYIISSVVVGYCIHLKNWIFNNESGISNNVIFLFPLRLIQTKMA